MSNLLSETINKLEIITLDRPEALNSLNGEMVKGLLDRLAHIADDSLIDKVLIKGAGGRAFCAGGDIKAARLGAMAVKEGRMALNQVVSFFVEEYEMNGRLFHFQKPLISFMNGITMGGGVGIAGACRYRVATEKTVWAMPEVTIGFFPDVGAAYYLAKAPHYAGRYLGLTGAHVSSPADLIKCGFATHFIHSEQEENLLNALKGNNDIETLLRKISSETGNTSLPYDKIEKSFRFGCVDEIINSLKEDGSEWALETIATIQSKSPTSVKVALRHIMMAESQGFDDVIRRDLLLAGKFLSGNDLIEGVRAAVVDKDKAPKWNPTTLQDIGLEQVEDYFNQNLGLVG